LLSDINFSVPASTSTTSFAHPAEVPLAVQLPASYTNPALSNSSSESGTLKANNSSYEPTKTGADVYAAMKSISNLENNREDEECLRVWQRCIEEAHKLLHDADLLLPATAASTTVAEIAQTKRGARYLKALSEIHAVVSFNHWDEKICATCRNFCSLKN
uniref:Roc domain-containing protein n=1 Tax=Gongylonema pulchrum TaxID=637853 RepID=A0A183DAR9_9BILA